MKTVLRTRDPLAVLLISAALANLGLDAEETLATDSAGAQVDFLVQPGVANEILSHAAKSALAPTARAALGKVQVVPRAAVPAQKSA